MIATCGVGLGLLIIGFLGQSMLASASVELWYLHHSYLINEAAVQKSKALIDKAVAAGYTGAIFWDSSFNMLGSNQSRLKEVMAYARQHHLKTIAEVAPFGWSNDVLTTNPNWAEAQRVIGTRLEVTPDGRSLKVKNSLPPLPGIGTLDSNISIADNTATIINPPGNARLRQNVFVQPWRQYHLSLSYKATGAHLGSPMVVVYDAANLDKVRFVVYLSSSEKWSDLDYLFNSGDSNEVALYMGIWGGAKGTIEFANVHLEETGLVWVADRDGAPFKLYDPENPSTVFKPGLDYDEVVDSEMQPSRHTFARTYHEPSAFALPPSTTLKPGQVVAADYYAVTPLANENQVALCLTEPGVFQWLSKNAEEVRKLAPPETGILLAYDELRQANSCFSCRSKNMTAGELLAWNFAETFGIYHQVLPDSSFLVWSDMFDPFHNAHDNFYQVEGTLTGSWKGLPREVGVLNWNLEKLKDSLTWFSGLNPDQPVRHDQVIAGFYDSPNAAEEARREVSAASGIPGIRGMMYTTWKDDYSKLKTFADAARAAWPDYLRSVPTTQ